MEECSAELFAVVEEALDCYLSKERSDRGDAGKPK
jgi:hypothetical protein